MTTATRAKARATRETIAEEKPIVREPVREAQQSGYFDENGNPLVRRRKGGARNDFDFHSSEIPEGWDYQWIRHTVHGDAQDSEIFDMMENGWRPVPHERHASRFAKTDVNGKGCIMRQGQLLVERPMHLTQEARAEDQRRANDQMRGQFQRFNVELPDNVRGMGINPGRPVARQQTDDVFSVRQDAMPKHEIAID